MYLWDDINNTQHFVQDYGLTSNWDFFAYFFLFHLHKKVYSLFHIYSRFFLFDYCIFPSFPFHATIQNSSIECSFYHSVRPEGKSIYLGSCVVDWIYAYNNKVHNNNKKRRLLAVIENLCPNPWGRDFSSSRNVCNLCTSKSMKANWNGWYVGDLL